MPTDILAYIGAAAMVVLAFLAYRYWRSTAAYAHRVRESHARQVRESYRATVGQSPPAEPDPSLQQTDPTVAVSPLEPEGDLEEIVDGENRSAETVEAISGEHELEQQEAAAELIELDGEADEPEPTGLHSNDTEDEIVDPDETMPSPAFRLIEDLEPRKAKVTATNQNSVPDLLKEINEELAALPSGIELMNLPLLERRRVADRREELSNDRARLLEQPKKGNHRRSRKHRDSGPAQ